MEVVDVGGVAGDSRDAARCRAISRSATTASSLSDSIIARLARLSAVNSSRARTDHRGGTVPAFPGAEAATGAGEDDEDKETGKAPSLSRTDTHPTLECSRFCGFEITPRSRE